MKSPYQLPFAVRHDDTPLFAAGRDVTVTVELLGDAAPALEALDDAVLAFTQLASTGALSGARIPPWDSTVADCDEGLVTAPGRMDWVLRGCSLDDAALLNLAHLLLDVHVDHPLREVVISAGGRLRPLEHDPDLPSPYPPVFASVPFSWSVSDEVMDSGLLRVRFAALPDEAQQEEVTNALLTWGAATATGAYAVAPELPRDCGMQIDPDIIFLDDELEWSFTSFRAHPDAFSGLANVLTALSKTIAILEASVE